MLVVTQPKDVKVLGVDSSCEHRGEKMGLTTSFLSGVGGTGDGPLGDRTWEKAGADASDLGAH